MDSGQSYGCNISLIGHFLVSKTCWVTWVDLLQSNKFSNGNTIAKRVIVCNSRKAHFTEVQVVHLPEKAMHLSCASHVTSCEIVLCMLHLVISLSWLRFSSLFQDFARLSHKNKTIKACGGVNEENVVRAYMLHSI